MRRLTEVVHTPAEPGDAWNAVAPPIYQTATFGQRSMDEPGVYDYSRSGNPTRTLLERHLASLEGGARALAYASGLAAMSAVVRLLRPGDRVVAGSDLYGGTWRLLSRVIAPLGIAVDLVDAADPDALAEALRREARLVLVETPTNPMQRVVDLRRAASLAHDAGAWLCVDGSLATPWLQQPLAHGADVVVHSATKALCGHADATAGAVVVRDPELGERLAFLQNAEGTALSPFEAWLVLRGAKTLGLRVEASQRGARRVAEALRAHPLVREVYWPGFADHPGHALHASQARGPGALVSFTTGDVTRSVRVADRLQCFVRSVSFGSVHSVATLPCRSSHATIPDGTRAFPADLVRLSIGIEDPEDLVDDLAQALAEPHPPSSGVWVP